MAFLLIVSMYAVFTGLQKTGIFNEQNASSENVSDQANSNNGAQTKPAVKKATYRAPAVTEKSKRIFLEKTTAAITKVKKRLDAQYDMVYKLSLKKKLTPAEKATIDKLLKSYKVDGIPCLLKRLRTHPVSIVIAQAALETGWGSSRFYKEANNIFGIWSYNKNEPRMAAGVQRNGEKTIYVKKYPNLEASIEGYYRMMAKGRAYAQFRTARLHTDNPFELIPYLDHYSELRHEYVKRLYYVIKSNKFYLLDDPQYAPPGWKNIKVADAKYLVPKKEKPAEQIAEKCKKDDNDSLNGSEEDKDSSHATDLTTLSQSKPSETLKVANVTDLPKAPKPLQDTNRSDEKNNSIKPIRLPDVNTAATDEINRSNLQSKL